MGSELARKPKPKPRGRPPGPRAERREVFTVRLPTALVARVDAHGQRRDVTEQALIEYLDKPVNQTGK